MAPPIEWDDQQELLDELLLEIFPSPPTNATECVARDWSEAMNDNDHDNDTDGDAAFASPVRDKHDSDSSHNEALPPSSFSAKATRQLEMRRKRNRESMRRVRQRKRLEYSELRTLLPGLEARLVALRAQQAAHDRVVAPVGSNATALTPFNRNNTGDSRMLQDALVQLQAVELAYRRENAWLAAEIEKYDQALVALHDVLYDEELRVAHQAPLMTRSPNTSEYSSSQSDAPLPDAFIWTTQALRFLPHLAADTIDAFIARSVEEVVAQIDAARTLDEAPHLVLGWRVRRAVAGAWIHVAVSKDFVDDDVETVANRTWAIQSQSERVNATMPQHHRMHVLRVINDAAVVCARNLFFPGVNTTNYCSIYVLVRLATPRGVVIAQRSLVPRTEADVAQLASVLGPACSYVTLFYGMILERHVVAVGNKQRGDDDGDSSDIVSEEQDMECAPRGCTATFGGLAGNGSASYAQSVANDLFLAMLRWESACIRPLYRLST